jgi:hypothetical protein
VPGVHGVLPLTQLFAYDAQRTRMETPVANPNAVFEWVAEKSFNYPNLKCRKGQRLPDAWQNSQLVRKLKEQHGEKAISRRQVNYVPEVPEPSTPDPDAEKYPELATRIKQRKRES